MPNSDVALRRPARDIRTRRPRCRSTTWLRKPPAKDLERAKRWTRRSCLTPAMDLGWGGLVYRTGGTNWLIYQTPSAGTGKHTLGGWTVPNIDDAMRDLRAKGVTFEEYALGQAPDFTGPRATTCGHERTPATDPRWGPAGSRTRGRNVSDHPRRVAAGMRIGALAAALAAAGLAVTLAYGPISAPRAAPRLPRSAPATQTTGTTARARRPAPGPGHHHAPCRRRVPAARRTVPAAVPAARSRAASPADGQAGRSAGSATSPDAPPLRGGASPWLSASYHPLDGGTHLELTAHRSRGRSRGAHGRHRRLGGRIAARDPRAWRGGHRQVAAHPRGAGGVAGGDRRPRRGVPGHRRGGPSVPARRRGAAPVRTTIGAGHPRTTRGGRAAGSRGPRAGARRSPGGGGRSRDGRAARGGARRWVGDVGPRPGPAVRADPRPAGLDRELPTRRVRDRGRPLDRSRDARPRDVPHEEPDRRATRARAVDARAPPSAWPSDPRLARRRRARDGCHHDRTSAARPGRRRAPAATAGGRGRGPIGRRRHPPAVGREPAVRRGAVRVGCRQGDAADGGRAPRPRHAARADRALDGRGGGGRGPAGRRAAARPGARRRGGGRRRPAARGGRERGDGARAGFGPLPLPPRAAPGGRRRRPLTRRPQAAP